MKHKKYRKKRRMKKLVLVFLVSVFLGIAICTAFCIRHLNLETDSSKVAVSFQGDTLSITLKTAFQPDAYRLYKYDENSKEFYPCGEYIGQTINIDNIVFGEKIKLRLCAVNYMKILGYRLTISGTVRELTIMPVDFNDIVLNMFADPVNRTVNINWESDMGNSYEVYLLDDYGKRQFYTQINDNAIMLDFNSNFPLPDKEHPVKVAVRVVYYEKDYTLYGPMSNIAVIEREDLLENKLFLEWEQIGERQYALKWQACRGEWYELQQWISEEIRWRSEGVFHQTEEMYYQTGHLPSSRQVRFRVISYDDIRKRDREEFETEPSEVTFHTDMSPLYCTIWPIMPLKLQESPDSKYILDEIPAGQALCVLEERGEYFKVLYHDNLGFVDSSFCMINLPEYIGDLCEYNITSSVHSMSSVHGYHIPGVTGTVIRGYENIYFGNDNYLVPYLYPCTRKLCKAITNAARDGYRFRIYDAFRPNEATRYYYDTTESMLDYSITDKDTKSSITLREIMTNKGKYRLSSFLAASVSAHNRGIALDLTMVDLNTNEELKMQTDIHDLSAYSVITQNNNNARLLAKYMKEVGYHDLFSEWWHFQDDETKEEIGLKSYLREGISVEGWKKNDIGWRYQLKDGSFYESTMEVIHGKSYTFNAEGYCVEGI